MQSPATIKVRELARQMRKNPTPAERHLWNLLRLRPGGLKWRRQSPLLACIVDFYCPKLQMVIEVGESGAQHDKVLRDYGFHVARISNERAFHFTEESVKAWLTGPPCLRI